MCITSAKAELSKTKILSMALDNGRHLLSYSNKAKNLSGRPNSMILPIPGEVNKDWFYNTTEYNNFMSDIERDANAHLYRSAGILSKSKSLNFEEFELGFYKVITTNDIDRLKYRLLDLNESQRPEISEELLNFFKLNYEGWSFVVCIFTGSQEMDAQPIMFEYKPMDYNWIYFPTMDSHTGGAPDLTEKVKMDHTLILDQKGLKESLVSVVNFSQELPEILKRRKYVAHQLKQNFPNGDIYYNLSEIEMETDHKGHCFSHMKKQSTHPGLATV